MYVTAVDYLVTTDLAMNMDLHELSHACRQAERQLQVLGMYSLITDLACNL